MSTFSILYATPIPHTSYGHRIGFIFVQHRFSIATATWAFEWVRFSQPPFCLFYPSNDHLLDLVYITPIPHNYCGRSPDFFFVQRHPSFATAWAIEWRVIGAFHSECTQRCAAPQPKTPSLCTSAERWWCK
jgi:hypothetical protein